ncbi:nucleophile aminohydrolase [Polychytrium aggregatum]|uniref:nucleophile aminohydrolase n=1 Tax=Polychytrium aggregatum TaxID=110093 RepID=UPI0022FF2116|nr:nucleophile aminohydrolase [Polychytrium aggregatum]KAI9199267.1 nucleophile aminohydrolase [Polychytrium aggregatum]
MYSYPGAQSHATGVSDAYDFSSNFGHTEASHRSAAHGPTTRTQSPIVTGTSVLGIKYKDGVMLAADTLASYGSLARFRDVERVVKVGDFTVVGASGDISDFQHIQHVLQSVTTEEYTYDDGHKLSPRNIYELLSRIMYNRRTKIDPLWNSLVIGGNRNGDKFLGYVDLMGTTYEASTIATGYGSYIAQPLLRKAVEGKEDTLTEAEAIKILDDAMRVLWYRDARSSNKIQRATITAAGVTVTEPYALATEWGFAEHIRGYGVVYGA